MIFRLRKFILFLLLTTFYLFSYSQHIEVKGIITNEQTKLPVDFATIHIEETKNHRLLGYGFSNEKGEFSIEIDTKQDLNISLSVAYIGYTTHKQNIPITNTHYNTGVILLHESTETLDAVVITATPPILIKNDTVQFNARSFKTKEDAVAEDLLKKLPGISIDNNDGSIRVNGIDVSKILVNGEPFFSKNPKVALKIISKDLIQKIEITNSKSEENEFTGNNDDTEAKTINIILEKRDKGTVFGNVTAGLGSNKRYEANGVFNHMQKKSLLTVLAFSNNINKNNFSYDDESETILDNNRAIKTESNIGANYSNKFNRKDKLNLDYLFSDSEQKKGTHENRISLIPTSPNSRITNTNDFLQQGIHQFNLKTTNYIFDNFKLISRADLYYKDKNFTRESDRETKDQNDDLIHNHNTFLNKQQTSISLNSKINAIYKFPKLNSYLNYQIETSSYNLDADSQNTSETFFNSSNADVFRNQTIYQRKDNTSLSNSIKYGQKISTKTAISYQFNTKKEIQENHKETSDINEFSELLEFNNALSYNQYINITKNIHNVSYKYRTKSLLYILKASHLKTTLENKELNRNIELKKDFNDYLYHAKLRYRANKEFSLDANYRTKSVVPKNNELLTITDNTNPLYIVRGNPNLKRELEHLASINVRTFNSKKKLFFFNRISYHTVTDKIIDKITVNSELITTKTYINNSTNHTYSIDGSISKDYKKSPLFYSLKFKWYANVGENSHLTNDLLFKSTFRTFNTSFFADFNYNDLIEISPRYILFLDKTKYNTNQIQNQSNIQHTFGLNITTFAPKRFTIFNEMQYNLNPKFKEDFGKQSFVWNVTANYSIVPNKAKLKLTVFNILNEYNNTSRTITESRNSTYTYDVLKQYFMLSFKYIFKNS